jgi:DNA invertase Pin-like site-specific DNA recombinase
MDRLARKLDDLRAVVRALTCKGVRVEFAKEGLVFTGDDSPMANLMLSMSHHMLRRLPGHEVFRSKVRWVTPLGADTASIS